MNNFSGTSNANKSSGPKDPAAFNDESDNAIALEPADALGESNEINFDDVLDDDNGNPDGIEPGQAHLN